LPAAPWHSRWETMTVQDPCTVSALYTACIRDVVVL